MLRCVSQPSRSARASKCITVTGDFYSDAAVFIYFINCKGDSLRRTTRSSRRKRAVRIKKPVAGWDFSCQQAYALLMHVPEKFYRNRDIISAYADEIHKIRDQF